MSLFHYRVIVLDPENCLGDFYGWKNRPNGSYRLCAHTSLNNTEIITTIYLGCESPRLVFESRCARPDGWREVDNRLLNDCFNMPMGIGRFLGRQLFWKYKVFLIIRNPMIKTVFENLLKNDKFKCKYIRIPDMIAPGYVAVSQE